MAVTRWRPPWRCATSRFLQEEELAGRAAEIGAYFLDALHSLKSHKNVGDVRGKGLLIGVELVKDRSSKEQLDPAQIGGIVDFCRDQGVIVGRSGGGRRFRHDDCAVSAAGHYPRRMRPHRRDPG